MPLPDELLEEVLLRLPPHEPANLIRVALVCRRWCRLVSDPGFRRRFREFHRRPPLLGMLCNGDETSAVRFVPTAAFCSSKADGGRALDARHGRVLLRGNSSDGLVVWDPITNEKQMLPISPQLSALTLASTAAILCADAAAGATGACDHLDCHSQPFVLVFAGSVFKGPDAWRTFICTYESKTDGWTEPIYSKHPGSATIFFMGSALVGNALYFMEFWVTGVLKYNMELQEISWIRLPSSVPRARGWHRHPSVLIATENGELGLATKQGSKLCIWLRKQDDDCKLGDDEWKKPSRAIELKTLLPADAALSKLDVVCSVEGLGIIFLRADDVVYTIDIKTYEAKEVYKGKIKNIVPYMSFYTPALEQHVQAVMDQAWVVQVHESLRC